MRESPKGVTIRLQQAPLYSLALCTQVMAVWPCCTALLQFVIANSTADNDVLQPQVQRQVHAHSLLRTAFNLLQLVAPRPFLNGLGQQGSLRHVCVGHMPC